MSFARPRHRYSFRDYLDIEEMSAVKHEYVDGEIYAMAGGTPEHAALCAALIALLGGQLRGGPCRVYTSDLRLRIRPTGLATYPDAAIICGPLERDVESPTHVTNPTVLFEVLSPSTEDYDLGEKRDNYQQIASLSAYVVVAQDRRSIEMWRRDDGGAWSHALLAAGQTVDLPAVRARFSVDELYETAGLPVV